MQFVVSDTRSRLQNRPNVHSRHDIPAWSSPSVRWYSHSSIKCPLPVVARAPDGGVLCCAGSNNSLETSQERQQYETCR
jgi:hypothetical protein